jgi:hypothetical protein
MRAQKRKGTLLHAPIHLSSGSRLASRLPGIKRLPNKGNKTFGNAELCAWRYAPGVCRFQTTRPDLARKLSQRSGARLVAWSVNGGYLRLFEETIEPWRAQRLVMRYTTPTNGAFSSRILATSPSETAWSIKTAARVP